MATRSLIAVQTGPWSFRSIYCHHDGYPLGVGKTLMANYGGDNIEHLIDLGDLSALGHKLEPYAGEPHNFDNPAPDTTIAYHRDRQEPWANVSPHTHTYWYEVVTEAAERQAEWVYLFDIETRHWRVLELNPHPVALDRVLEKAAKAKAV